MNKKIDFSTAIESLKSLNSNTNSITQTISKVQVIVENTSNNISKLENYNGSLAEEHSEKYQSQLVGTVNHKNIFDVWAIWKINGCNNIQSTINNLISKISNLDNSINELKLKSINADAAIAIMEKYNVGIEAILASGITLPQDLLDKSFATSQLAKNMATDEYKADNREWQSISDENIKWWTDKVLKFEKDPNHIGSNAWLVWQQDENGEWIGMGFTDEKTALKYAKIFNSELINYQEEIQQSIPKDINANLLNTLYSFGLVSIIPSNQDFNDLKENLKYQNIQSQLSNALDTRNPTANKYLTKQIDFHGKVTGISELTTGKYQQISFEDGTQINVWKDKRPDGKIIGIHQYNNEGKETIYTKITEDSDGNIKGEIKNYDQNQETPSNESSKTEPTKQSGANDMDDNVSTPESETTSTETEIEDSKGSTSTEEEQEAKEFVQEKVSEGIQEAKEFVQEKVSEGIQKAKEFVQEKVSEGIQEAKERGYPSSTDPNNSQPKIKPNSSNQTSNNNTENQESGTIDENGTLTFNDGVFTTEKYVPESEETGYFFPNYYGSVQEMKQHLIDSGVPEGDIPTELISKQLDAGSVHLLPSEDSTNFSNFEEALATYNYYNQDKTYGEVFKETYDKFKNGEITIKDTNMEEIKWPDNWNDIKNQ